MPPIPPAHPPNPTTVPTARRGNVSDVSVKRLADQAWWHAAAMLSSPTASQALRVCGAAMTDGTVHAMNAIVVLRARFTVHPRLISADDMYPPATDPTSATR